MFFGSGWMDARDVFCSIEVLFLETGEDGGGGGCKSSSISCWGKIYFAIIMVMIEKRTL